jgi:dienelactone hydrolase
MGFSHGGWVALWAAHRQFARRFKPEGAPDFAAYLPVYPAGCFIRLQDEASLVGGPVRIFAGGADDWTPAAPCREWAARVSAAGRAASFVEYEGAPHAFDNPRAGPTRRLPHVLSAAGCVGIQQRDGRVLDPDGRPLGIDSPCLGRGASIGYDPQAHRRLIADAKAFLDAALRGTSSAR